MAKRKTLTPEEAETRAALTAKRRRANILFRKATKGRPEHDAALDCLADILDLITTLERLADGADVYERTFTAAFYAFLIRATDADLKGVSVKRTYKEGRVIIQSNGCFGRADSEKIVVSWNNRQQPEKKKVLEVSFNYYEEQKKNNKPC